MSPFSWEVVRPILGFRHDRTYFGYAPWLVQMDSRRRFYPNPRWTSGSCKLDWKCQEINTLIFHSRLSPSTRPLSRNCPLLNHPLTTSTFLQTFCNQDSCGFRQMLCLHSRNSGGPHITNGRIFPKRVTRSLLKPAWRHGAMFAMIAWPMIFPWVPSCRVWSAFLISALNHPHNQM